ncbi:DUF2066 domain-containing protein [Vibrio kasasachensis]|uniref:DUF2066 domain-containing protein n=1 Tax=Vibrio kasasachensis TaxID=2910248 RepID=UPI003D0FECA6
MRSIVLFALGLIGFPALALTNVDLYQAQVVLDQSLAKPDARARVDGMEQVIVRASGMQDALSNPVVRKALKQSAQYIDQISYGKLGEQQTLKMRFNGPQISALLSQAQLPTWSVQRANVLVWLVEESQSERVIAWEHSNSETLDKLKLHATERGLPLTVPVGDFDDVTGIDLSDLWGGFALPVGQASQRYPADAVLVIRASNNNLRWTLYDQTPKTIGVTRQAPLSGSNNGTDAADKLINQISDYYAKQSSVVVASKSSESVKVRFISLDNAIDFFVLERKLQQLNSVASLDILKIQGNQVTFSVHLLTTPAEFEQQVSRMREATPMALEVEAIPEQAQTEQVDVGVSTIDGVGTEASLPNIIEQAPMGIEPEPMLMFEWQSGKYVAPVPVEPDKQEPAQAILGTDIDA